MEILRILLISISLYAVNGLPTDLGPCDELDKLIPDPKNCSRFYECTLHGWVGLDCNPGLYFNPLTLQCDYPENVDCSVTTLRGADCEVNQLKPDPKNCSRFYECTEAGWVGLKCPRGLEFNPSTSQCDYPENVDCSVTTLRGADCEVNQLKPDPKNCSRFYECTEAGWVGLKCPRGLEFNPSTSQCDYPENVDCSVTTLRGADCEVNQLKPDSKNCSKFYECTEAGWVGLNCARGLEFNPSTSQCDYPENVDCSVNILRGADCEVNQLKPDPKNCSRFYECTEAGWVGLKCPRGLEFNPSTSLCDFPENVDCSVSTLKEVGQIKPDPKNCSNFYEWTETGWVKLACPPGLYFNNISLLCDYLENVLCPNGSMKNSTVNDCGDLSLDQLEPDPTDCSRFIQCTPDGLVSLPCSVGLYFNPQTSQCDYPDNVPCDNELRDSRYEPCDPINIDSLYPDPENCGGFFQCSPAGLVPLACPAGLYFNPTLSLCDWPNNVECQSP